MHRRRRNVWVLMTLAGLLLAPRALAAPDEDLLGKAEGYPACGRPGRIATPCLVGSLSHYDEVYRARKVTRGAKTRPLKRAAAEPAIRYGYESQPSGLDDYLSRNRTTGLLVLKGETILVERYQYDRAPDQRMTSYSMAKTIVAMLVGIAKSEGRIRALDDLAEAYVADLRGTPYGQTSIRHLLTMSSGVRFVERYDGWDDFAMLSWLSIRRGSAGGVATVKPFTTRERPPGERFQYSSAEAQVLGLVLRAATGKPLAEYLSEKIWQRMGAEADASWIVDKGGYEAAFIGVNATVRDFARFGMLLANDGTLDGQSIIPADWVRDATTVQAPPFEPGHTYPSVGFGYLTWILPGTERQFALRGARGQAIFVDPKLGLVMVHTAARDLGDAGKEMFALWAGVVESVGK